MTMLAQQDRLAFSNHLYLYDLILIIPQDNLLRRINMLIDFTFVYKELVSKYSLENGRTAKSPVRMFKYLLLKTTYR